MTDIKALMAKIDHTALAPNVSWQEIEKLCQEGETYQVASVCIPPCYVARVRAAFPTLKIATVIGFPNGYQTVSLKMTEIEAMISDGADELDVVINLTNIRNGEWERVTEELRALRKACGDKVLKVIFETGALNLEEVKTLSELCVANQIDFVKTSTGFNFKESPLEKVKVMAEAIQGSATRIKVSGGIRTLEDVSLYDDLPVARFGASKLLYACIEALK